MNRTFSAIAIDLTDRTSPFGSVHIRDKASVAQRLAAGGLAVAYGADTYWQGPTASAATLHANGDVSVTFSNCGAHGLNLANTSGWELCVLGGDQNCSQANSPVARGGVGDWINAVPDLESSTSILVTTNSSDTNVQIDNDSTVLVRYAWDGLAFEYMQAGVYAHDEGFPAGPFVLLASN